LGDFHRVEVLQVLAALDAEGEVAFLAGDWVAVEGKLAQLVRVLDAADRLEFLDAVVGEEYALEARAVRQALD
jgi:hypothetical protein